jgi:phosphatidylserine/phosphatidylglycerophosphate/cardiolipin synthase-like enzyme
MQGVTVADWFLSAPERGNDSTVLDSRHAGGLAWSSGNAVRALIHGATYFAELLGAVSRTEPGDLIMFTDWRGDPDEPLNSDGITVSSALADAARRGVVVKGLIWRSHWDRLAFSEEENRHLGVDIEAAGGECLLDMRVRLGGSHHQKFVVLRHPGRPELDVAFMGGIDLCHGRRDDESHQGDPKRQPMSKVYGPRPPWHDAQLEVRGPAVGDVETVFRERWNDPNPLSNNPIYRLGAVLHHDDRKPGALPAQLPDPPVVGTANVQLLRTYPYRRPNYPFAPLGERSVARGYDKAVLKARGLIYLEDQYFWSTQVVDCFVRALRVEPELRLIVVIPRFPDQDGRISMPPNLIGRERAIDAVRRAGGDRVAFYGIENHVGTPVYVHAKVCVVDDVWVSIGSDNINRRSWTHDSELTCAVIDDRLAEPGTESKAGSAGSGRQPRAFAREVRLELAREHLDRSAGEDGDLIDPAQVFKAFQTAAAELEAWHRGGARGPRPAGRLRPYSMPKLSATTKLWANPLYRVIYDPDGRPRNLRRRHAY